MTTAQRLAVRSSEIREKLNELSGVEELTDEQRTEVETLTTEYRDVETKYRAAVIAEDEAEAEAAAGGTEDKEMRERRALRARASLTAYLRAALSGRNVGRSGSRATASGGHRRRNPA